MKTLEVRVPHSLDPVEVRRRLDAALVKARDEMGGNVSGIDATWEDADRLRFLLGVMGLQISGQLEVLVTELVVLVDLPGTALLFKGRIRDGIQERLGGLLTA
ncbi:MAG: polyhydroxyalkanoic acid system family protein [Pirellulales bacterium]|jgi:hypothetical protein